MKISSSVINIDKVVRSTISILHIAFIYQAYDSFIHDLVIVRVPAGMEITFEKIIFLPQSTNPHISRLMAAL